MLGTCIGARRQRHGHTGGLQDGRLLAVHRTCTTALAHVSVRPSEARPLTPRKCRSCYVIISSPDCERCMLAMDIRGEHGLLTYPILSPTRPRHSYDLVLLWPRRCMVQSNARPEAERLELATPSASSGRWWPAPKLPVAPKSFPTAMLRSGPTSR